MEFGRRDAGPVCIETFMNSSKNFEPTPRALSESEIHDRLYGSITGKKKAAGSSAPSEGTWTGTEILSGELKQLRAELISLREEKEILQKQIWKIETRRETVSKTEAVRTAPVETVALSRQGWLSHLFGVLLLLAAAGYLFGVQKLQASPSMIGADPTPYTVQVAVYDIKNRADQAVVYLGNLGYESFLIDVPRQDGKPRYRVYMGSFVTQEEADQQRAHLEADPRFKDFKDAFVRLQ